MVKDNILIKFSTLSMGGAQKVEFNAEKIINYLAVNKEIVVLLNDSCTISDTEQMILQLVEYLYEKESSRYEYTPQNIYWGKCLGNEHQIVKEVTYCLSKFKRYE